MTTLPRHGAALPGRGRGVRHHREVSRPSDRQPAFPLTGVGAAGYCRSEVDRFVGELRSALSQEPPSMSAARVAASRFHVGRLGRCYEMRPVDDYLDEAEAALRNGRDGEGTVAPPAGAHRSTWWVYAVAAAIIAVIVTFVVT